jgi:hypothetical protein
MSWAGQVARAQLAQAVVEDRLAALIAQLGEQLADARAGQARVRFEQPLDLVAKRVQLRAPGGARVARRGVRAQRTLDGLAVVAGATGDLADRALLDEVHPADLGPAPPGPARPSSSLSSATE